MQRKVLFYGPYSPPLTGQSAAFKLLFDNFYAPKVLVDITKFNSIRYINTIYVFLSLLRIACFDDIDVVYFTCSRTKRGFVKDFFLLFFCRFKSIKVINHLHGADFKEFYDKASVLKTIISWSYKVVNTHIVLLESLRDQFSMFNNAEIHVVSNAVFKDYDSLEVYPKPNLNLVFLSNIMCSKGIFEFLQAVDIILEKYNTASVAIIGLPLTDDLMSRKKIKKQFNRVFGKLRQKYKDRINYNGFLCGKAKIDVLLNSSILVLPTYYISEAQPIAILEAMRTGNAIITTNHNYLGDLIDEKNGLLIEPKSIESIVAAVKYLFDNPSDLEKMQINNLQQAIDNYSSEKYIESVKKIINFKK